MNNIGLVLTHIFSTIVTLMSQMQGVKLTFNTFADAFQLVTHTYFDTFILFKLLKI